MFDNLPRVEIKIPGTEEKVVVPSLEPTIKKHPLISAGVAGFVVAVVAGSIASLFGWRK